jgi:hypothetical protein
VKQAVRVIYQKLAQLKGCTPADLCASRLWTGARNLNFQPSSKRPDSNLNITMNSTHTEYNRGK